MVSRRKNRAANNGAKRDNYEIADHNRNRSSDDGQPRRRRPPRPAVEHYGTPTLNGQRLPFSGAVRVGDILYLSGAIGRGADGKPPEGIEAQTKATLEDIGETLKLAGLGYDRIFHCTAMLSDMKNWADFNKAYVGYFPEGPLPARSAFGSTAWRSAR